MKHCNTSALLLNLITSLAMTALIYVEFIRIDQLIIIQYLQNSNNDVIRI